MNEFDVEPIFFEMTRFVTDPRYRLIDSDRAVGEPQMHGFRGFGGACRTCQQPHERRYGGSRRYTKTRHCVSSFHSIPPCPQKVPAHSTREGPRVKQKIAQSAEKAS